MVLIVLVCGLAAPHARAASTDDREPSQIDWSPSWSRFRPAEYAATLGLGLALAVYSSQRSPPVEPRWRGGSLFDDAADAALVGSTDEGRRRARVASDYLWYGGMALPFLVDVPVALLAHREPSVAGQMLLMNLEAFVVAGWLGRLLQYEVGRARPSADGCERDGRHDDLCGSRALNASFPSGHTLGVATAAGLTCVHHQFLPLYGNDVADAGACAGMIAATIATGLARIVGERHHLSDVVVGAALGFGVGYGLPRLLHYRSGAPTQETSVGVQPMGAASIGIGFSGAL